MIIQRNGTGLKVAYLFHFCRLQHILFFSAIADRNYPFGITAGFGYIAAQFGDLSENPVIKRFSEKPDAFIEFFLLIGLVIGGYTA